MRSHDVLLLAASLFSEVIGTLSGFGSSTFFVPLAISLETFSFVLALTAILHCFSNLSKVFLFQKNITKNMIIQLAIPSVAFTGFGALLSSIFSSELLVRVLGVLLIFISLRTLLPIKPALSLSSKITIPLCGLSGFLTGLVGTGGAIRGAALVSMQLEKNAFIALSSSIDLGGDFLRAGIYLYKGYMDWNQWFYIPLLGVTGWLGAFIGKKLLRYIHQKNFERIVAIFIFMSGIAMMVGVQG